jgi:hypothetical protein
MKKEENIELMGLENPLLKRLHNFGISAVIAIVLVIIGLLIGGHFVFGFGIFMLFIIGLLTGIAVIEYILAIV